MTSARRIIRAALRAVAIVSLISVMACGGKPGAAGLRDAFAQQLSSNRFITAFERNGDDLRFSGPGAESDRASWRVHIDSAVVEANGETGRPYKGVVTSSWYADGQLVTPRGGESNLPIELTSNGLAQECWAFWDQASRRWTWE